MAQHVRQGREETEYGGVGQCMGDEGQEGRAMEAGTGLRVTPAELAEGL